MEKITKAAANYISETLSESIAMTIDRNGYPHDLSFTFDLNGNPIVSGIPGDRAQKLTRAIIKTLALMAGGHHTDKPVPLQEGEEAKLVVLDEGEPEIPQLTVLKFSYANRHLTLQDIGPR